MKKSRLYTHGFTMVELIITTLLIVILFSVAIPVASLVASSRDRQILESHATILNTQLKTIDTYVYTGKDPEPRSEEEIINLLYTSDSVPKKLKQLLLNTANAKVSLSNLYTNLEIDVTTTEYEIVWDTIGQRFVVIKKEKDGPVNGES